MFTVAALCYGDYPDLADKLLKSFNTYKNVLNFKIGLNQVSDRTRELVSLWAIKQMTKASVKVYEPESGANVGKYPLLRQMLADSDVAEQFMWFDDDSYLDVDSSWWDSVYQLSKKHTQIGAVHMIMQRNKQFEVIKQQPWYTGKILNSRHRYTFATGGWWVANTAFLKQWDYPFKELHHNGGDSILGELIRQQDGKLLNAKQLYQCHCESCLKATSGLKSNVVHINVGGRQGRRGIGRTNEYYVWSDGNVHPDISHQDFRLRIQYYGI